MVQYCTTICIQLRGNFVKHVFLKENYVNLFEKALTINVPIICRFLMRLKGYVRTRSHPEGSIAESYIFDESLTFALNI